MFQPFQVSFTSPSPFGHGPSGRRPSFNNIGAHIDLGPTKPQKILGPESLLFISSTVSNKIVIGSQEEITTTAAPAPPAGSEKTEPALIDLSPGRSFPSFPIRGDDSGDSPSIKPKLDFSRRNKATFKFGKSTPVNEEEVEEEREENVTEQNEFSSTAEQLSTTTITTPTAVSKNQFVVTKTQARGKFPRVKSNLLFNRKNKERFRLKLAQLSGRKSTTTTTTTTSDPGPSSSSPPASEIPATTKGSLFTPRKKFNLRKKPQTFFKVPNVSITNSLLKFRNRSNRAKFNSQPEKEETDPSETTVAEDVSTESVLSVETELQEEEEEEEPSVPLGGQLDHVRKAQKAPLNGNIRVEFKKKAAELTGNRGRFFINPDGRKPRVKSNIRAHLANRGQHFAEQHQPDESGETFDGASSQLDLTPFNNIKREVDNAEAPGEDGDDGEDDVLSSHNEIVEPVPTKPVKPVKPLTFALPLLPLEPVILNPRQANRNNNNNKKPPLPASILKHINHITDIRSLPPLPPNLTLGLPKRPTQSREEQGAASRTALLDQILVESSPSPSGEQHQTQPQPQPTVPFTTAGANKLSAFRALQQQVERQEEGSQQEPSLVSLV